jgi:hypothetical protein
MEMAREIKSRRKDLMDQLAALGIFKKETLLEMSLLELERECSNIHPHCGFDSIRLIHKKKQSLPPFHQKL